MPTITAQPPARHSLLTVLSSGFALSALASFLLWPAPTPSFVPAQSAVSTIAVVDVTAAFTQHGYDAWSSLGGIAGEVPLDNAAHIFRFQPSDRTNPESDRHTFYLEDPGHAPGCHSQRSLVHPVTVPTDIATETIVYQIDGDLVIDNDGALQVRLYARPGQNIVFDVTGDIVFGDDFLRGPGVSDVTFRARQDGHGNGGHIILSDDVYGTLRIVEANLDSTLIVPGRVSDSGVTIVGTVLERFTPPTEW